MRLGDGCFDRGFFLVVRVKEGGTVLRPEVGGDAARIGGVMGFPKDIEQLVEAYPRGVVGDFDRLGVAGFAGADFLVGRVFGGPARVA